MPVAWTRLYKNDAGTTNRILTTTMGSATDLQSEGLRRLVVNAVYWGLGLDVPAQADVSYVDEYKPPIYGFNDFRKGLRPSDFALGKRVPGEPLPRPGTALRTPLPPPGLVQVGSVTFAAAAATIALADDVVAGLKRESPELGMILGLPDVQHGLVQDNSLEARARSEGEEDAWQARLTKIDAMALEGTEAGVIHGYLTASWNPSIGSRVCEAELWSVDQIGGWQVKIWPAGADAADIHSGSCGPMRCSGSAHWRCTSIVRSSTSRRACAAAMRRRAERRTGHRADDRVRRRRQPLFLSADARQVREFTAAWREHGPRFARARPSAGMRPSCATSICGRPALRVGVSALPNGATCYRAKLREMTTLTLTAEDLHKTGLAELERIKAEERAIAKTLAATDGFLDTLFTPDAAPRPALGSARGGRREGRQRCQPGPRRRCRSLRARFRRPRVVVSAGRGGGRADHRGPVSGRDDRRQTARRISD